MVFDIREFPYRPVDAQPRHGHDELLISVILRGNIGEEAGGVVYRGSAGDIVVKPPGLMHSNVFDNARIVSLQGDPARLDFPLPAYGWHRTTAAIGAAMRLVRHFLAGEETASDIDDLLGAIPSPITTDRVLAKRAGRVLDECFTDPIDVQRIARDLGVHRVYLARVFRLQWGCTPRDYVQRLRVRAAANALASTKQALADIALGTGFSDQAHMSRIFARTTGMTPGAFRRLART